jgi:ketosteroid isomerase-like protein
MLRPRVRAPKAETLRAFYSCFDREDWVSQVKAFLAPAVVWHVTGDNPLAGNFSGPDCGRSRNSPGVTIT